MRVLVSGGTGLVGRYVVESLLSVGYQVTVGGRRAPAPHLFSRPVDFRPLSLDPDDTQGAIFDDVHFFVHAAFDHVAGKYRGGEGEDPAGFRRRNLEGSVRLFDAARSAGVRRCVFLSSRAVYDGLDPGARLDEAAAVRPASLYGEVKLLAEQALTDMSGPGFVGASLRLTGVYGDLRPNKWDGLFSDYRAGRAVPVRAGSEVHGLDVGQAVRLMLESEEAKVSGEVFNVSDLVTDTHEILSRLKAAIHCPHPLPDCSDRAAVAEMRTLKIKELGWEPGGRRLFDAAVAALARSL
ncbi:MULTISPECIES: NAD-dependent epimerase/dehydratase family protein [Alphaproteobacteria]|uniref:UDP-glucose 4-epimerase n=2 Tax=Alphaproteobacteria TaxID=28211 RepID=A0A512HPC7_9HYPH|nr:MULTISPECIES: NAD(P)-dependent oxidoreductase [Alphaproteobacteria]GEO87308.1 UDP-glucose 4-epimerase [Ciceribacter naphthalenivorans]GLR22764.1 UDP-glucose 4-epimerase [Ciceribacter naphthalenivorans]GLT05620.1 UDP-glucose 4-epimerase [Sphingomonas psychrolutea]